MSARDEIIEKANLLAACVVDADRKLKGYIGDLTELRELCPWAFDKDGVPLPAKPQGRVRD